MFTTIFFRPIFNLLVLIYAILPGHDFGLAIILFTIVVRLLMWPLVKKQLKQAKAMRELQPEMKRIKAATKGNKQKESQMLMELYKEREVSPFGSLGTLVIQTVILIGLYIGLRRLVFNPKELITFSYPAIQHFSWIKHIAADINQFHDTLFGWVNLNRAALNKGGGIYWSAMLLVVASAVIQYFLTAQLMPSDSKARKLRDILKDAGKGKQADQSEVSAAVGRGTRFFLPAMIFIITVNYPSALSLYWFVSGLVAYIQQAFALREDTAELKVTASNTISKDVSSITEAEIVDTSKSNVAVQKPTPKKPKHKAKRRKR